LYVGWVAVYKKMLNMFEKLIIQCLNFNVTEY
jgi:hypothetical protein